MKKLQLFSLLLTLCLIFPLNGFAYDAVVVFGDGLSDTGNAFTADPTEVPATLYYDGRLSNGSLWIDYLVDADHLDVSTIHNYAFMGAETGDATNPSGIKDQVDTFTAAVPLPTDGLYIIWAGINDFIGGDANYLTAVSNISDALDDLVAYGAEKILVLNMYNLGIIPTYNVDPSAAAFQEDLTDLFNSNLESMLDDFDDDNSGVTLFSYNINTLFRRIVNNPDDYGFDNVEDICPSFAIVNDFTNDNNYLFWDAVRPTTEAHEIIADRVYNLVKPATNNNGGSGSSGGSGGGCFITTSAAE